MFVSAGGVLLDEHRVTEIIPGHEVTVRTTKATFRTKKLVITAGSWTGNLLKTLGLEIPFEVIVLIECIGLIYLEQVLDTKVLYWKVDTPEDFSKENFPAFLGYVPEDGARYFYGLPIHEYPGLVKVGYIPVS